MRHAAEEGGVGLGDGGGIGFLARSDLLPQFVEVEVVHGHFHHEVFASDAHLLPRWSVRARQKGKK